MNILGQAQDLAYAADEREDSQTDLSAVLGLFRRHKWTIILTFVLIVGAAFLVTTQLDRRYTASALVVVDNRDSQLLGFQSDTGATAGEAIVDTEVEIARSSAVIRRAADALDLANASDPAYGEKPPLIEMLKTMVGLGETKQPPSGQPIPFASLPVTEQVMLVEQLSRSLDISRRGLTNIISISATGSTPDGAATIANTVANAYLEEQIDAKLSSTDRAASFLRDRVESLATRITDSDRQIDTFVTTKLAELGSPESKALLTKLADEAKKRSIAGATLADIQQAVTAQDYVRMARLAEAQQSGLAEQHESIVAQLSGTDDQTQLAAATQQLQTLDAQIKVAAQKRIAELQDDISLSNGLSAAFRSQVDSALADVRLPTDVSAGLFRLQRDAEASRALYDSSIAKLRQVEQQSDFKIPDSRVIASATPPTDPSFPPRRLILAAAGLLALGAGLGLAFLREHFIGGITSVEQFENLTGLPVAAAVPRYSPPGGGRVDMAIVNQPLSAFSEAIRRVQLGVDMLGPKTKRCILITSSVPGDGKTTLALALARQMAMTGSSTIVIDADLRHPSVHRYLDMQIEHGLIEFLSRPPGAALEQLAITKEAKTGVSYVLGAEASAVATDTLLMSTAFDRLMKFARENYDVVIVDTPPVGLVVDATIVARHCDVALFVVRHASTRQREVRTSAREMMRTKLPVYGVLNLLAEADGRRYGYGHKYRAYYGAGTA